MFLSGSNTYTGATTIEAGTLWALFATNAFGSGSAVTVNGGARLNLGDFDATVGSLAGAGNVFLGSGTLTTGSDNTSTVLSGSISGTGGLNKIGTGTLTLSWANHYTGPTAVHAGTLRLGHNAALAERGGHRECRRHAGCRRAGRQEANIRHQPERRHADQQHRKRPPERCNRFGRGRRQHDQRQWTGRNWSLGGVIGGDSVTIAGGSSVIFRGTNTYTGTTTIEAGATLDTGGGGLAAGSGVINEGALIFDQPIGTALISQAISGSGTVTKLGSTGTVTLSGANTYTGTTTVLEGTLRAGATNAFSAASAVTLRGGATLDLNNHNQTIGSLAGAGFVTLGTGTLTTRVDKNNDTEFMGVISGSGGFTKIGTGTLNLMGINSYAGGTNISTGTLAGRATSFGSGPIANNARTAHRPARRRHPCQHPSTAPACLIKTGVGTLDAQRREQLQRRHRPQGRRRGRAATTALWAPASSPCTKARRCALPPMGLRWPIPSPSPMPSIRSSTPAPSLRRSREPSPALATSARRSAAAPSSSRVPTRTPGPPPSPKAPCVRVCPTPFSPASAHSVAAGATLDLAGFSQSVAALTNAGTVSLIGATPGTTLTVTGPYVGNNGLLRLGTFLGDSASASDRLVLSGPSAVASGRTTVQVVNLGGLGALTTGNGIELVSALNGATTTAQTTKDAFALAGRPCGCRRLRIPPAGRRCRRRGRELVPALHQHHRSAPLPPVHRLRHAGRRHGAPHRRRPRVPARHLLPAPRRRLQRAPIQVPTYRAEVPLVRSPARAAAPGQPGHARQPAPAHRRRRRADAAGAQGSAATPPAGERRAWGRVAQYRPQHPAKRHRLLAKRRALQRPASRHRPVDRCPLACRRLRRPARWRHAGQGLRPSISELAVGSNDLRSQYLGGYATWTNDRGFYADAVLQAGRHRYGVKPQTTLRAKGKASSPSASWRSASPSRSARAGRSSRRRSWCTSAWTSTTSTSPAPACSQERDGNWLARAGRARQGRHRHRVQAGCSPMRG